MTRENIKMSNRRNSVAFQLLKIVFSLYFVVTLITTAYQLFSEYRQARREVISELKTIEKTSTPGLSRAIWNFNKQQVTESCKGLDETPVISGSEVVVNNN